MKKNRVMTVLMAAVLLLSLISAPTASAAARFPDVPNWCASAVSEMAEEGILSGYQDGTFKPSKPMTRAQMAKVLHRIYLPEFTEEYCREGDFKEFIDYAQKINGENWANFYIGFANSISIQQFGYEYQEWQKPATRIEMAAMAAQYAFMRMMTDGTGTQLEYYVHMGDYIGDYETFKDDPAKPAVFWMYGNGFVNGVDQQGSFHPYETINRAQACAILYRIQHEDARVFVNTQKVGEGVFVGGDYKPGSVYGPKLTQKELDEVKEVVVDFVNTFITDDMSEYEKVLTAQTALSDFNTYAPTWKENGANTAWGALVYGQAQCSGYARAMKALCDGMGIGCYYVHANETASNPSHQFNLIEIDGKWYICDPQLNDDSGNFAFLISKQKYQSMTGITWDYDRFPTVSDSNCPVK